jgi:hypothetical protein
MQQLSSQIPALALAVALLAIPAATFGQTPAPSRDAPSRDAPSRDAPSRDAPSRDANVWDWRAHQPTQAEVVQREKAAGIAASPSQRDSSDAALEQLYRQALERAHG